MIAPTWGTSFFDDKIHILIKKNIDLSKNEIFIRPHLMSILKRNITNKELINENFNISTGKLNFNEFDILITDWSGIYIEFAKINNKFTNISILFIKILGFSLGFNTRI